MARPGEEDLRSFVAVEVPLALREQLKQAQRNLGGDRVPVRWVRLEAMHLTMKFLGNITVPFMETMKKDLAVVAADFSSFSVKLAGIGSFPPAGPPRVVWAGVRDSGDLSRLRDLIEEVCVSLGCDPEPRPFSAHLTLGRVTEPSRTGGLRKKIEALAGTDFGAFSVDHFVLFKSDLSPAGPRYTPMGVFPLAGGSRHDA